MASKKSVQERKRELALRLDATRQGIESGASDLRERLNPIRQVGAHFRRHPIHLFGVTAAGVATLTSLVRRMRRRKKRPRSVRRFFLGMGWSLAKPALRLWLLDQAREYIHSQHMKRRTDSLLGP